MSGRNDVKLPNGDEIELVAGQEWVLWADDKSIVEVVDTPTDAVRLKEEVDGEEVEFEVDRGKFETDARRGFIIPHEHLDGDYH